MFNMDKKLYRSRHNKEICGVCAGLAKYFDMDPTVIRVLWALFTIFGGGGLLAYIALALIIPVEPENDNIIDADN